LLCSLQMPSERCDLNIQHPNSIHRSLFPFAHFLLCLVRESTVLYCMHLLVAHAHILWHTHTSSCGTRTHLVAHAHIFLWHTSCGTRTHLLVAHAHILWHTHTSSCGTRTHLLVAHTSCGTRTHLLVAHTHLLVAHAHILWHTHTQAEIVGKS
jgi:hypothetical protein